MITPKSLMERGLSPSRVHNQLAALLLAAGGGVGAGFGALAKYTTTPMMPMISAMTRARKVKA
jgi:hypothetical protein